MHSKGFVLLTLVAAFAASAWGIKCYQCNSADDKNCQDPFDESSATALLKDCSDTSNITHTYCRKTIQKVALKGRKEEDKRVVRSCGHMKDPRVEAEQVFANFKGEDPFSLKCYRRVGTFEVESWYCGCIGDSCNPGTKATPVPATFFGLLAIGGLFAQMMIKF